MKYFNFVALVKFFSGKYEKMFFEKLFFPVIIRSLFRKVKELFSLRKLIACSRKDNKFFLWVENWFFQGRGSFVKLFFWLSEFFFSFDRLPFEGGVKCKKY